MHMNELPMFTYNLWMGCLHGAPRYIMSIILSSYQHCDEQQFQTPSCALYTIFPVTKLDLVIQALLLDYIIALERKYAYSLCTSCYYIEFLIKTKYTTKSTSVSQCSPENIPGPTL